MAGWGGRQVGGACLLLHFCSLHQPARPAPVLVANPCTHTLPCACVPCPCREFQERYKIDVKSQPRACHRLRMGCEKVRPAHPPLPALPPLARCLLAPSPCSLAPPVRSVTPPFALTHLFLPPLPCPALVHPALPALPCSCLPGWLQMKRVLTTNAEAPVNVECIMNDIDASGMITREVFEEAAKSVLDRLLAPVKKVGGGCPAAVCCGFLPCCVLAGGNWCA